MMGWKNDFEGLEPTVIDVTAEPAATVPLVFENAATACLAAFVPWVFVIARAVLSVIHVVRAIARFVRRPEVVPLVKDDQDFDDNEADHNVWNDLLQLFAHHTIAPLLVLALDDSSEPSLALSCPGV